MWLKYNFLFVDINSNIGSLEISLDRFINIGVDVRDVSLLLKIDLTESIHLATELQALLKLYSEEITNPKTIVFKTEMISGLKYVLSGIDWSDTDKYFEGKTEAEVEKLKKVFQITYQLLAELDNVISSYSIGLKGKMCVKKNWLYQKCFVKKQRSSCVLKQKKGSLTFLLLYCLYKDCKLVFILSDQTVKLLQHIDQYIELIEIVEEISAVIKIEDVKETLEIAKELKENIVATENIVQNNTTQDTIKEMHDARGQLVCKLQKAISALQVQVLENAQELAPALSPDALQRFVQVTAQLQANLVVVTSLQVSIQAPLPETSLPDKGLLILHVTEDVAAVETTVADKSEPIVLEQVEIFGDIESTAHETIAVEMDAATLMTVDDVQVKSGVKTSTTKKEEVEDIVHRETERTQELQIVSGGSFKESQEIGPLDEIEVTTTTGNSCNNCFKLLLILLSY